MTRIDQRSGMCRFQRWLRPFVGREQTLAGLRFRLVVAVMCGAASGCTDAPQTPPITPAAVARPAGPVSVNGTFNGIMQTTQGTNLSCGTMDMLTLNVVNNAFSYTLNQPDVVSQPVRSFNVVIAPDGSFDAQSGAAYIRGTASGTHIAGDIVGDSCGYHFEADSSGAW
jgi:hypothetical protein